MKLNKVLALALSGVMAVSMLAGCSGNPGNGGQEGENQPPVVTTDAAEVLNKIQSAVKFDDDATLNGYMAPVETLKPSVVETLSENGSVTSLKKSDNAVKAIMAKMVNEDANQVKEEFDFNKSNGVNYNKNTDDVTETVFYAVNADKVISIEHLMTQLSSELNTDKFKTKVTITGDSNVTYLASYTGAVSVKKATGTDEDGKTYNAYVVAVSITRTLGDKLV